MSSARAARSGARLRNAAAVLTLLATGTYLFVYLWRWEWHRAVVAGVLFLAAEVGLATSILFERLRSIERRLDDQEAAAGDALDRARARLADAAPEPRAGFAWLTDEAGRMSVFVPLLLGAGVVLSALAWAVERVARVTAGPVLERALAARLAPLTLPAGTLRHGFGPPEVVVPRRGLAVHLAVAALALAGATLGVDALGDATQTRPDPYLPGTASAVEFSIANRAGTADPVQLAHNLWGACASQVGHRYRLAGIAGTGAGRVEATIEPSIGRNAERRLRGCIEDATSDRLLASVVGVRRVTAEP